MDTQMDTQSHLLQDLRTPKVAGMALFDWALTATLAYGVQRVGVSRGWLHRSTELWKVMLWAVAAGVVAHKALGVDTTLGYYLGVNRIPN